MTICCSSHCFSSLSRHAALRVQIERECPCSALVSLHLFPRHKRLHHTSVRHQPQWTNQLCVCSFYCRAAKQTVTGGKREQRAVFIGFRQEQCNTNHFYPFNHLPVDVDNCYLLVFFCEHWINNSLYVIVHVISNFGNCLCGFLPGSFNPNTASWLCRFWLNLSCLNKSGQGEFAFLLV